MSEEVEFLISQYLDGTLLRDARQRLERQIAQDPELAAAVAEYRKVNELLKSEAALPEIRWDALAERISDSVAKAPEPVQRYRLPLAWVGAAAAMAACAFLTIGVAMRGRRPSPAPPAIAARADVTGPRIESDGRGIAQVQLLPPRELAGTVDFPSDDGVVVQRSNIYIAGSDTPDGDLPR